MFYDRFVKLCEMKRMSPAAVAKGIGLSNSSTTTWKRGAIPKGDTLQKLADYFGVSVDFLLDSSNEKQEERDYIADSAVNTDDPTPTPSAVDDLGLSPKALQYLRILNELTKKPPYDTRISLLSYLLENRQFDYMLALCERYVRLMGTTVDQNFRYSSDYTFYDDALKPHGYVISTPDIQANALFNGQIVNLLRTVLDERVQHIGSPQIASTPPEDKEDTSAAAGAPSDTSETPPEGT